MVAWIKYKKGDQSLLAFSPESYELRSKLIGLPAFPTFKFLPIANSCNSGVVLKAYYPAEQSRNYGCGYSY